MKLHMCFVSECLKETRLDFSKGLDPESTFERMKWLSNYIAYLQPDTMYLTDCRTMGKYMECRKPELPRGTVFLCVGVPRERSQEFFGCEIPCVFMSDEYDLALIGNKLLDYFDDLREWDRQMEVVLHSRLDTKSAMQKFLDLSRTFFDSAFVIWNKSFHVLACLPSKNLNAPIVDTVMHQGYFTKEVIENIIEKNLMNIKANKDETYLVPGKDTLSGYPLLVRRYKGVGAQWYSAVYFQTKAVLHPGERARLEILFNHIMEYFNLYDNPEEEGDCRVAETFFRDILSGSIQSQQEIQEKAQAFHIQFNSRYLCYAICLKHYSKSKVSYLVNYIAKIVPTEYIFEFEKQVICVKSTTAYQCESMGRTKVFEHLLEISQAVCGISSTFDGLGDLTEAYKQAKAAWRLGMLMDKEQSKIYFYKDYYYYHMLEIVSGEMDIRMMYNKELNVLLEDDKKNGTDNFRLLETLLESNLSVTDAAAKLFLHRNTFVYRLKKLEQIIHLDLNNSDEVQRLYFSLRCYRYLKAIESH